MAGGRQLSGLAVGAIGIGSLFVYGGVTGRSPLAAFQSLVQGNAPATAGQAAPITPGGSTGFFGTLLSRVQAAATSGGSTVAPSSGSGPATATQSSAGDFIAAQAESYIGAGYQFGGHPADGPGHWDCSSFVNWLVGFKAGLAIPGVSAGHYDGKSHGPIALQWDTWSGLETVGHSAADAQRGYFACWQTHIGICTGNGQMVSARSVQLGTSRSNIAGSIPGELLSIRRFKV